MNITYSVIKKIVLFVFFGIISLGCSLEVDSSITAKEDIKGPVLIEVTAIKTPDNDTTPDYTFSSDEAGTITYGGSCSSITTEAVSGNNTITLNSLSDGTYSDCTISVPDNISNVSILNITSFRIDTSGLMGGSIQKNELSLSTVVTTLAGSGSSGSSNGTGTSASFGKPDGITTDGTNLYVVDKDNELIRKIVISTGVVTTIAGTGSSGSANGTGTSASFFSPSGITTDGINLYVADTANQLIRQIVISTGVVTTLAGSGIRGFANGTGTSAAFKEPVGITTDGINLYLTEYVNNLVRQIVISTGVVTTLAGSGTSGDSNGTGTDASFTSPRGITTDGTNLYVSDTANRLIRQIVISTGVVTTLAGSGSSGSANGTGTAASFNYPMGITTDGTSLYVAGYTRIRQIVISTGVVTTLAGSGSYGSTNGTGTASSFSYPRGITTDGTNLYVSDTDNQLIRQIE